jgi:hypothetical protein
MEIITNNTNKVGKAFEPVLGFIVVGITVTGGVVDGMFAPQITLNTKFPVQEEPVLLQK